MSVFDQQYFYHIIDEIEFLREQSHSQTKETFLHNVILQRAFVRSLEVIGEAVKKISADCKNLHPEIPWKKMAGTRDKLIHNYFGVDYELVWDIIHNHLPELHRQIVAILQKQGFVE